MIPTGTISEILQHKGSTVWSVSPNTMVFDAIQMMADKNIGALLVIDQGKLIGITPAHTIEDCMRLMTENRIRHLPVLDGDAILGIVSIGDLVNWIISAQTTTIYQLQTYITGCPS